MLLKRGSYFLLKCTVHSHSVIAVCVGYFELFTKMSRNSFLNLFYFRPLCVILYPATAVRHSVSCDRSEEKHYCVRFLFYICSCPTFWSIQQHRSEESRGDAATEPCPNPGFTLVTPNCVTLALTTSV
jgi:hypothetical protein